MQAGLAIDPSNTDCRKGIEKSKDEIEQQGQFQQQEKDKRERLETFSAAGNDCLREQDLSVAMSSYEEGLELDPTHTGKEKDTNCYHLCEHGKKNNL